MKRRKPRSSSGAFAAFVRIIGEHAEGLERLDRDTLRRGRLCVGCEEGDGVLLAPVLGWVCESCEEVIELVYEIEIERVQEARVKIGLFIESVAADARF